MIVGPHTENFADVAAEFDAADAWRRVPDADTLTLRRVSTQTSNARAGRLPRRGEAKQHGGEHGQPVPGEDLEVERLGQADQLERLEGLLQRGTISQEEFDSQKRKLLG